jgi:hypothetical protein
MVVRPVLSQHPSGIASPSDTGEFGGQSLRRLTSRKRHLLGGTFGPSGTGVNGSIIVRMGADLGVRKTQSNGPAPPICRSQRLTLASPTHGARGVGGTEDWQDNVLARAITADPRLLARYDGKAGHWHIAGGVYAVAVGMAADALELAAEAHVEERRFGRRGPVVAEPGQGCGSGNAEPAVRPRPALVGVGDGGDASHRSDLLHAGVHARGRGAARATMGSSWPLRTYGGFVA